MFNRLACCLLAVGIVSVAIAMEADIAERVEEVSEAQLARLKAGLQHGATLVGPMACLRSRSHKSAYYVCAMLAIPVSDTEVRADAAVWLIGGSREQPSLTYSVDGFAQQFSDWRPLKNTPAWNGYDQDVQDLRKHVENMPATK